MTTKNFVVKNGLTTGNIILSAANSNVVANYVVANLSVPSTANLGAVGNITITGGSANYVLSTDGTGNLSWVAQSGGGGGSPGDVYFDSYTADGSTSVYNLSISPSDEKYVSAYIDGIHQTANTYSVAGNVLTFVDNPIANSIIEFKTLNPGSVTSATIAGTVTTNAQPNITSVGILNGLNVSGNIVPTANVTYNLGNSTNRFKDLWLSGNTIYLGNTAFSTTDVLPFTLTIDPELLTINVDAPEAGDDTHWLWTWNQTTLPYARSTIVNAQQISVPLYMEGTYTVNNFAANVIHGNMTQTHHGYFKWIDGAGTDNLINWVGNYTENVTVTNANINGGTPTIVQQYNFSVPSSITPPTLVAPNISYNVSVANGAFYMSGMAGEASNATLGPVRRGGTYTFHLDSSLSGHNFYLTTDNGTGFVSGQYVGEYTTGVTGSRNNGSSGQTTLVWNVDSSTPDTLFYQSAQDANIRGSIVVKDLAVETNINGNYIVYFQHMHEGHKTPIELKPIPQMVNQMCLVYDQNTGRFVPQDMATYVDNTPSFKNKIREVAGTATLIAPNGVAVVPTVLVVENISYLPLVDNKEGDIAFDSYEDTMYVWQGNAWRSTKPTSIAGSAIVGSVPTATTANSATIAATVTTNAQPNITSVGTLTSLSISGNTTISGNLTVSGTTTVINSTAVSINDINLILANNATTASQANGAGITINGANASFTYVSSSNNFSFSHPISVSGNVSTNSYLLGNGAYITGLPAGYANTDVAAYLPTYSGIVGGTLSTAAQPNVTSLGTLTGITSTGTANFTGASNISLGSISNLHITGGSANYVLKTDGAGNLSWTSQSGGTQNYVREYVWKGGLTENVGTLRYYIHTASTLTGIYAYLVSAGLTQSTAVIKKNGTTINTITIPANTTSVAQSGLALSLAANDYLTVDITQSSSASDLYINIIYQG